MLIKQLVVEVQNKVGELHNVVSILSRFNIDMKALLSNSELTDSGIVTKIRMIVMNNELAVSVLENEGYKATLENVVIVDVTDATGSFAPILKILKESGINIEYVYTFLTHVENKALAVFNFDNNEKALSVLKENHFTIVTDHTIKSRYGNSELFEERDIREYLSTIITP
jgi:hypothetical protein